MKKVFSALALLSVLFLNSCSSDNNDSTISQADFVAAGTDFLSTTPNEETTYLIVGSRETYEDGSYIGQETYAKPVVSRANIPSINGSLNMLMAGYYNEDNTFFTIPKSFYYPNDKAFMGTDERADDIIVLLPKEIKVGAEWNPYEKTTTREAYDTRVDYKKASAKIAEYLPSFTSSNTVSYKDVIRVDVAALDSTYWTWPGYTVWTGTHYNLSVYLAKGVGIVEVKTISVDKNKQSQYGEEKHTRYLVYNGKLFRKQ